MLRAVKGGWKVIVRGATLRQLTPMDEQIDLTALRDSIRDVLTNECENAIVHRHYASGDSMLQPLWTTAAELGWLSLAIPEEYGGLGLKLDALATLYSELGRALAPIPVLPTLLAAELIAQGASTTHRQAWLSAIAAGEMRATISYRGKVSGRLDGDVLTLSGRAEQLLDGGLADILIVEATIDGEQRRVALLPGEERFHVETLLVSDRTRSLGRVVLDGLAIPATRVFSQTDETVLACHAAVAIACDAVGAADAILEITIDYLKTRQQFGRAIGSFQALKHRIADHKASLVVAKASVDDLAQPRGCSLADALAAKAHATRSAGIVARDCIHLHGGIGFTQECDAHLYLRRVLLDEVLFGTIAETLDAAALELAA